MSTLMDVVFITLNEAHHLKAAIDSFKKLPVKVYVVDSGSTDGTVDLALERGLHIVQRPFTSFGDQWNFALTALPLTAPWTMKMDPDERLSPGLREEIGRVLADQDDPHAGYAMPRRLWFMGRPLHVHQDVLRLWKRGACRFSDVLVNEHPKVEGPVGRLKGVLEHLDSPDLHHWIEKQNYYTTLEAIARVRGDALAAQPRFWGTPLERVMFLKKWFYSLPGRYGWLWAWLVFRHGVWRDGREGLAWAHLRTELYRQWEFKMIEMRNTGVLNPGTVKRAAVKFDERVPFFE